MTDYPTTPSQPGQDSAPIQHIASVIRPQQLLWGIANGDPTILRYAFALVRWLAGCEANQCLACERTFEHDKPRTFFIIELNVSQSATDKAAVSGVCEECSTKTDVELCHIGVRSFFGDETDEMLRTARIFFDGHDDGSSH